MDNKIVIMWLHKGMPTSYVYCIVLVFPGTKRCQYVWIPPEFSVNNHGVVGSLFDDALAEKLFRDDSILFAPFFRPGASPCGFAY